MRSCLVPFCRNKGTIEGVVYFRLTQVRVSSWLRALHRDPNENVSSDSSICSDHFVEDDFITRGGKRTLKPDAVPTVNLRPDNLRRRLFQTRVADCESLPSTSKCPSKLEEDISNVNSAYCEALPTSESRESDTQSSVSAAESVTQNKHKQLMSSSHTEGLRGSPKKRRSIARFMHNYSIIQNGSEASHSESSTFNQQSIAVPSHSESNVSEDTKRKQKEFVNAIHSYSITPQKMRDKLKASQKKLARREMQLYAAKKTIHKLRQKISSLQEIIVKLKNKNMPSNGTLKRLERTSAGDLR